MNTKQVPVEPTEEMVDAAWGLRGGYRIYKAMLAAAPATEPSEVAGGEIERLRGIEARYNELLYAVTDKQEGRTRHETALGYIQAVDNIGNYHKGYQAEKAS